MKLNKSSLVLIADDYMIARHMLKQALMSLGMTNVIEASNGQEALEIITQKLQANEPVRMVFSDLNMPKMSGLELLIEIRKQPELKDMPFIMVTVESEKTAIEAVFASGATDYLVKPFTLPVIDNKISTLIKKLTDENV
jgi:two-component system chemotaxis response regulator CheY